jgi:DNA-binding CsgD family transcriptional regulator
LGDFDAAKADFARALPIVAEMSFLPLLLTIVLGVGDLLVRAGDRQSGSRLLRVALWHPAGDSHSRTTALRLLVREGQEPPSEESLQESDIDEASVLLESALSLPRSQFLAPLVAPLVRSPEPAAGGEGRRAYPHDLTEREVEVLNLVAHGKSNREIAEALFISVNTAANHVKNILSKTNAANRTEAASYAIAAGLLR